MVCNLINNSERGVARVRYRPTCFNLIETVASKLSYLYDVYANIPIIVMREIDGRIILLGQPDSDLDHFKKRNRVKCVCIELVFIKRNYTYHALKK